MKSTNKNHLFIGATILSIICIITLAMLFIIQLYSFPKQEKKHIQDKAILLFKESINEDFEYRSRILAGDISIENSFVTHRDSATFKSTTLELKMPIQSNQSLDKKMTDFLQSVLAVKNPINVHQLDSIFQQKLKEENINIKTAICLTDTINKKNNYCTHFNTASFIPLFTDPYQVSSIGISLKTFIKIPQVTLIRRVPTLYWIALFGWLLFTSSIGYAWYNFKNNIPVLMKDSAEKENILQEELIQKKQELETFKLREKQKNNPDIHIFSPYLIFEKDTKTLRYYDEIVKLTRQQQQLLAVFCNALDNTCSINNLCDLVWKGSIVEENTIQQAISRLNMKLKTLGLYIQYEFKDSYKLTFKAN